MGVFISKYTLIYTMVVLSEPSLSQQVVLAVMVATTAHQAYGIPVPGTLSHGTHAYGYGQAPYVGPLASSIPAGIGGKVIPVTDTYEVAAARDQFFRAYQNQLNTIYAIRASKGHGHRYHDSDGNVIVSHSATHNSYGTPSVHSPVVHTSHAVHVPVVHTSHAVHTAPVVRHDY